MTSVLGTQPFPGGGARGRGRHGAAHARPRSRRSRAAHDGVRANVVAPGWADGARPAELDAELAVADTPLGRLATRRGLGRRRSRGFSPRRPRHVTGEILRVDGGYTITRGSRPDPRRH